MKNPLRKRLFRELKGEAGKYFVIFILPALIIYLLFSITPFLYTIYYSFTDYTDMNPINLHFVVLNNYIKVLQTPVMLASIKNSVIYAILLTGFQTLLGLPLAVAMLGDQYLPSIACVITFNALVLWTAVSLLVEQGGRRRSALKLIVTGFNVC